MSKSKITLILSERIDPTSDSSILRYTYIRELEEEESGDRDVIRYLVSRGDKEIYCSAEKNANSELYGALRKLMEAGEYLNASGVSKLVCVNP